MFVGFWYRHNEGALHHALTRFFLKISGKKNGGEMNRTLILGHGKENTANRCVYMQLQDTVTHSSKRGGKKEKRGQLYPVEGTKGQKTIFKK